MSNIDSLKPASTWATLQSSTINPENRARLGERQKELIDQIYRFKMKRKQEAQNKRESSSSKTSESTQSESPESYSTSSSSSSSSTVSKSSSSSTSKSSSSSSSTSSSSLSLKNNKDSSTSSTSEHKKPNKFDKNPCDNHQTPIASRKEDEPKDSPILRDVKRNSKPNPKKKTTWSFSEMFYNICF